MAFCSRIASLIICVLLCSPHEVDAKPTGKSKKTSQSFEQVMEQARFYKRTRQNLPALEAYQKALKMRPNNSEAHAGLGWTLFDLHYVDDGLAELDKAVELDPRNAIAHHHLAVIYMILGRLPDAAEEYRKEYAIDPRRNCNCGPSNALLMAYPPGYSEMMRIRDEEEAKAEKRKAGLNAPGPSPKSGLKAGAPGAKTAAPAKTSERPKTSIPTRKSDATKTSTTSDKAPSVSK